MPRRGSRERRRARLYGYLFMSPWLLGFVGLFLGPKVLSGKFSRWLNPAHLKRTEDFYAKYGPMTIILARFVPIVRTFAPFVAGVGKMNYGKFLLYNILGGALWVLSMTLAGYFLGEIPFVKDRFEFIVLGIVFVSVLPMVFEFIRHRFFTPKRAEAEAKV